MDNLYKKVPVRCPLTVRQQLTLVFAVLTALILFVAGFGIYALGDANRGFDNYVHGIDARASKASDLRTAIDERAIAARNIVLATSPTDTQGEKTRAVVAHEKVQAHLTELKRMVVSAEIVTEISAASAEQSTGVSQVGDAVTHRATGRRTCCG